MDVYNQLSSDAMTSKVKMWKTSLKFHLLQHICEHQNWINPRVVWCYGDVDLQHLVKEVALSCHPITICHMVLYKWVELLQHIIYYMQPLLFSCRNVMQHRLSIGTSCFLGVDCCRLA